MNSQAETAHSSRKVLAAVAVVSAFLLLASVSMVPIVGATGTGGTVQLTLPGLGTVTGQLQNVVIEPDKTVTMTMTVNDQLQTSSGPVQVTGSGVWNGAMTGSTLSGNMQGISGKVQACIIICVSGDFVGQGQWTGSLNGASGGGTLAGTITFTDSSIPQISVGQPYSVTGTWTSDFTLPVPEFESALGTFTIVLTVAALTLITRRIGKGQRR